jgi:hypothetical protein
MGKSCKSSGAKDTSYDLNIYGIEPLGVNSGFPRFGGIHKILADKFLRTDGVVTVVFGQDDPFDYDSGFGLMLSRAGRLSHFF